MMESPINATEVLSLFSYCPSTGQITSRHGVVVGSRYSDGYIRVTLKKTPGYRFRAHRLAWLAMSGSWPPMDIDHINGDRTDNRWENLRCVTRSINSQNKRTPAKTGKSGYLGVSFAKDTGMWSAQIETNGVNKNLGRRFSSPLEAHQAYVNAKRQLHAGCTI